MEELVLLCVRPAFAVERYEVHPMLRSREHLHVILHRHWTLETGHPPRHEWGIECHHSQSFAQ